MAIIAAKKSNLSLDKIFKILPKLNQLKEDLKKIGRIKNNSKVILIMPIRQRL